jgi:23S rRNA (uracil1939-C5)-methyltransferase
MRRRHGSSELRIGEVLEAVIEKGVYRGRGLARVEGRVVFVPRAHPGDRVRARVREVHAGWGEAALEELLEASPARRPSPCPYVPRCGGCVYQDLQYEAQLDLKESVLRETLARSGAAWEGPVERHASAERGWRLRASLHFAVVNGELALGLRQEGTRRLVDVLDCLQLSAELNETARGLRQALARRSGLGPRLRGLELLEAPDGRARVAVLVTRLPPAAGSSLASLGAEVPGLSGLGMESGEERLHWLHGSPYVEVHLRGLDLRVHARSFFQSNRHLLEALVDAVLDLVPPAPRSLDLYAGVGLFTLPLAARGGGEVRAVERAPFAVADARENVRRNRLAGVRVVEADVREALERLPDDPGESIVVDPPRTGLEPGVVERLAARRPQAIVYVSCDPATLGRDLALFASRGLRPDAVRLFDLFPDTLHLETVVRLRPA